VLLTVQIQTNQVGSSLNVFWNLKFAGLGSSRLGSSKFGPAVKLASADVVQGKRTMAGLFKGEP
jgi:hypothetical protein